MNNQEKHRLIRINVALGAIPFGHDGTAGPTASIKGAIGFQHDTRKVRQNLINAIRCLITGDPESEFEEQLQEAENYIAQRKSEGWE